MQKSILGAALLMVGSLCSVPHQIVIISHGEKIAKTNVNPYLNDRGMIRSMQLPQYFKANFPVPAAIFAQGTMNEANSLRPIQTMAQTAAYYSYLYPKEAAQFTIITKFFATKVDALAQLLLTNKDYDNKTIFICWCHDELQELAQKLGVKDAPIWPGGVYGQVCVIKFDQKTNLVKSFKIREQTVV